MFIKQKCIEGKGKASSTKHLYKAYCDWCDEAGIDEPLSSAHFGRNLGRKGYTQYKTSTGNGWKGIDIQYYDIDKACPIRGKVQDTSKFRRDELADLLLHQEPAESE
jgi:phage/plasmid-associated DNA primase